MTDLQRCPFCESAIPREALYCSRCGGKIPQPRAQATAPGIAPRSPTPVAGAGHAPPVEATASAREAGAGEGGVPASPAAGTTTSSIAPSGSMPPSASQSLSISRIQRPGRGLKVALIVLGAVVCAAAGFLVGHWGRPAPISVVAGPGLVELGQPRVAMGADLPDPTRFLDPGVDGGAVSPGDRVPVRPRVEPGPTPRPDPQGGGRPSRADGGAPAPAKQPEPVSTPDGGGPVQGDGNGNSGGDDTQQQGGGEPGQEGEDEQDGPPEGQLDTRAVIYVVRHYLPQVRACYERQLRNAPELRGQITMRFTVGAGGRVTDTSVVVNSTGSDSLATCVSANLRTWRFPEPVGGAVSFEYPFRFGSPAALPELPGATQDP